MYTCYTIFRVNYERFQLEIQSEKKMAGKDPTNPLPHLPLTEFILWQKLSSKSKGFQSMNRQYRMVKPEFSRAKLPLHVKFILSSDDYSYAIDYQIFQHGS